MKSAPPSQRFLNPETPVYFSVTAIIEICSSMGQWPAVSGFLSIGASGETVVRAGGAGPKYLAYTPFILPNSSRLSR